jgi:acyl-CoA synthetase (AMP-forming)/AMP-acid ligase II
VSVGRPLTNSCMFILGPDGDLLPAGAAGELVIGGAGVAAGYHRQPELTQRQFVTPQAGPLAGRRLKYPRSETHGQPSVRGERPASVRERVLQGIHDPRPPTQVLNSLCALVQHLRQAWQRRADPAVVLIHHSDLCHDLEGQMRYLADRLGIDVPQRLWPTLVQAATFTAKWARASQLVPDERLGLFTNEQRFFRSGSQGQWRAILSNDDLASYGSLLGAMASEDLAAWLHGGAATSARGPCRLGRGAARASLIRAERPDIVGW